MYLTDPPESPAAAADARASLDKTVCHDHPDNSEPSRVSGWFITVYTLTSFGANLTMLAPMLFGLAYKIQLVDPDAKEASLGIVVGIGALFNIVVTPLAGVLTIALAPDSVAVARGSGQASLSAQARALRSRWRRTHTSSGWAGCSISSDWRPSSVR
jgi:hypothetical protein